ncbi:MAG: tyrosine-type recombinase/integrase [Lachnospiraceae bacterium]|nr:tyrosine-type recombinase/integrase [Lachnospiraceae bacterium]
MATKKRKDGRYMRRFTINGKRFFVYGKTDKECRENEAQKRKEIEQGLYKSGKELTVAEFFKRWIVSRQNVKQTTLRTYNNLFSMIQSAPPIDSTGKRFIDLKLSDVETQYVRDLQQAIKNGRTTTSVNMAIDLLKTLFKDALNERLIIWNPCAAVRTLKREEPAASDGIHRALTIEETRRFLDYAADSWYFDLFVFLLNTGCRIGEAGAITNKDVSDDFIYIKRTITCTENGQRIIGDDTKTKSGQRSIPLNNSARSAIKRQRQKNAAFFNAFEINENRRVFRALKGGLINGAYVNENIDRICKAAGIKRFSVHALRATFATRCIEGGMQPKTLQEIMGHSNIAITMNLYTHIMDETKTEQMQVVNFY